MRISLRTLAVTLYLVFCSCFSSSGQGQASIPSLFQRLQSDATADDAAKEFREMVDNKEAKTYLSQRLPGLILSDPKEHPHVWLNAVQLAGAYRVTEAMPALRKWIGLMVGAPEGTTLGQTERLESAPAGKALVKIGEPAVPTLVDALDNGDPHQRWVASRALYLIGSQSAVAGLRDHLARESDPEMRAYIEKVTQKK